MFKNFLMALFALVAVTFSMAAEAAENYKIAWSRYIGWEPIGYLQSSGIMDKWNKKYGVNIQFVFVGDYVDSVALYASKEYNGVAVTNMDILSIAGVGGRHSNAIITGDYSNGNDGVGFKGFDSLKNVKNVVLVEYSVSHYLLAHCAAKDGVLLKNISTTNATDSDIPGIVAGADKVAFVTWNPMKLEIQEMPGVKMSCTSADIPGEIIDMIVVGDEVSDNARNALVGAWFEAAEQLKRRDSKIMEAIAKQVSSTTDMVDRQLETTAFFYTSADAVKFVSNTPDLNRVMKKVTQISFDIGAYQGISSPSDLGIKFVDGSVLGNSKNVVLTFDARYMKNASDGKLK